jgi:hypothetical protein
MYYVGGMQVENNSKSEQVEQCMDLEHLEPTALATLRAHPPSTICSRA